jgi:hypothetical protein
MEGDSDKAKRTLPFKEICLIKREEDNPLSFLVAFRDSTPFQMYPKKEMTKGKKKSKKKRKKCGTTVTRTKPSIPFQGDLQIKREEDDPLSFLVAFRDSTLFKWK